VIILRCFAVLLSLMALWPSSFAQQTEPPILTCDTLETCVRYLEEPDASCEPSCFGGIDESKGYFSLPEEFDKFGRAAIPILLKNLQNPDESVRLRAGLILNDSKHVRPEDHAAILVAYANGVSWLSDAAKRYATPEFVAKMGNDLRIHPGHEISMQRYGDGIMMGGGVIHDDDQAFSVFLGLGTLTEAYLIQRFACLDDTSCEYLFLPIIADSFDSYAEQMPAFTSHLFDVASRTSLSVEARTAAMKTALRVPSKDNNSEERLAKLRALFNSDIKDIRDMAQHSLVRSGDPIVLEMVLKRLDNATGFAAEMALFDLLAFREKASVILPPILKRLKDEDWDVRLAAVRVIAKINDRSAAPALLESIRAEDWELSLEAVEALGQFPDAAEIKKLAAMAQSYWHPAVRAAAKRVLTGKPASQKRRRHISAVGDYCDGVMPVQRPPKAAATGRTQKDIDDWNAWNGSVWDKYYSDVDAAASFKAEINLKPSLQIGEWTFTGEDNGEWGGSVTAAKPDEASVKLADLNLKGFFQTSSGSYFVTGLNHGFSRAFLHKLSQNAEGVWQAEVVMRLAGDDSYDISKDGTLRNIGSHGAMLVHPDGRPEWIMCPPNTSVN
jgi:HEAT repeat protein